LLHRWQADQLLGGDIVVHSNVGQGTTFAVSVPLQAHPEA